MPAPMKRSGQRIMRALDGANRKAERKLQRAKAKAARIASGERGAPIDWGGDGAEPKAD